MDALYNQYLAFSASKSPFIRHRAIEGMGNLFIRYPQFLLKPQTSSIIKNARLRGLANEVTDDYESYGFLDCRRSKNG